MKKNLLIITAFLLSAVTTFAQQQTATDSWTQKADFGGDARSSAAGFSIGTKGYIGTGNNGTTYFKDFWEYDPSTGKWTRKADFPGVARSGATGFSIGNKGYMGGGEDGYYGPYYADFWEYDPTTDKWTRIADFPGAIRNLAAGFSIGNKGYYGLGFTANTGDVFYSDFWEYDPTINTWTRKADYGGGGRNGAGSFSIGNKGYVGCGFNWDYGGWTKDFWEYEPATNKWTRKADFGGSAREYISTVGFSIGNRGYLGTGYPDRLKDFWEYDPASNIWTRKADLSGGARASANGFSIGNKGYIGCGDAYPAYYKDLWEYTPDNTTAGIPTITSFSPASGPISSTVTINGANFSANANEDVVYFGAVRAVVASATTTKLKVYVPVGTTYQPISVTVNGLTAYAAKSFVVIFEGGNDAFTQSSFAVKKDLPLGYNPAGFFIGDLDGDGRADLVSGDYNSPTISVFRNKSISGTLSFAPKVNFATGGYYVNCVGDLDGDGKPDIITANSNSNTVSVLRNTSTPGKISFATKIDFATGNAPEKVILGDLDGDGKLDVVTPNIGEATFSVLKNTSSIGIISLAPHTDYAAATKLYNCAIGDLDGDKKPDIVVTCNYPDHIFSIFKNTSTNGAISFAGKVDYVTDKTPRGIAIGDLDGDAKPDLAIGNFTLSGPANSLSIFRNISSVGAILFDTKVDYVSGGSGADNVSINDLNGDGRPDIILNNYWNDFISLFRNQSSPGVISFDGHVDFITGSGPRCVNNGTGDLDGDGKPDISLTNIFTGTVSVLRSLISDNGCTPPSNLNVTSITGSSAKLTWTLPVAPVSSFEIRYRIAGDSAWLYRKAGGTQTGITLQNLSPNATYRWEVRSNCGGEITQGVNGPAFTTTAAFASNGMSNASISTGKIKITISPNPVAGNVLNLHITNATANNYQLSITDMQGRTLINQNILLNGSSNKMIDVSALPRGIYILKVMNTKNEQQQIKFVKAN